MLSSSAPIILEIAIPTPLRRTFDYLLHVETPQADFLNPEPEIALINSIDAFALSPDTLKPGLRIKVPFAGREVTGILINTKTRSDIETHKLKAIIEVLDTEPLISATLLKLMLWAADYYQHPIGESLPIALPALLRKGGPLLNELQISWRLTDAGRSTVISAGAKKQQSIQQYLLKEGLFADSDKTTLAFSNAVLNTMKDRGWLESFEHPVEAPAFTITPSPLKLNDEQRQLIQEYEAASAGYQAYLLEGVTGSGKTEVYLQLIERVLLAGKQAMILVPEIGLTPQTLQRFKARFNCPMAIFHSNLSDKERQLYWQQAKSGHAKIIIGTRSALFSATCNLGLIIIDEEHDISYKQQDSLRYSARDLACVRAKLENAAIVLGTATPSLETLSNASSGKFKHWHLTQRAGNAKAPVISIVDIRQQTMIEGIAEDVLLDIQATIEKGQQCLIFINRRGFAPSLICHDCGWIAQCHACDARMTVHLKANHLRCHHCQAVEPITRQCPSCNGQQMTFQGVGTERLAMAMQAQFPDTTIFRIDRDTTSKKSAMPEMMNNIHNCDAAILVGTQMLAKGHHFPNVTLVIILEADNALAGIDYRASERFGQLLTQVIGRSGRAEKPGRAIIQSHFPEHPQLQKLITFGYNRFAMDLLAERQQLGLPPYSFHALLRLESQNAAEAQQILEEMQRYIQPLNCLCLGPYPASLQRRAYYYRYQLLIQSNHRGQLKQALQAIHQFSEKRLRSHKLRFSIDVDPQDMS
ncbi:MAG: primosomal protein N' [Pseudomonadales bacterium]|nr:primosomal protein N' [Pseudomonadales bacterium]